MLVAVLRGLGARGGHGLPDLPREEDDAGQGCRVGCALHAQVVRPVPRHVDDGRGQEHEEQHGAAEDDRDLAAFPAPGRAVRRLAVCRIGGFWNGLVDGPWST